MIRQTLELQGFRVGTVAYEQCRLWIRLEPDARFSPRRGVCKTRAPNRDRKPDRVFKHVPFRGMAANKESFRGFRDFRHKNWAQKFLARWFWWATHSRLKPRDFAWMLKRHKDSILTCFDPPITNSVVEGLNNKAKAISHRSYGYRTARTFITNLHHCVGNLKTPETLHSFA
jgi:hypothetical protein